MRGSHRQLRHPERPGTVTVSGKPGAEIPPGTLSSIRKQAGLKRLWAMQYAVVIEQSPTGYGAYVPDLPGCIAAAETREDVVRLIQEAIEFHIEGMRENGEEIPRPSSSVELVHVAA